ncbi:hypothetical protein GCM10011575_16330 [Microlunatus endophyticus]|uniref:Uncharacterized protein n=1 Tax=Microlunatus endophyticus TaxID=1716077 RepID=A0A917S5J8_9ACTN|nr:hypothetical protein GCM10011575_16330 [Microlunatus endophyticus]
MHREHFGDLTTTPEDHGTCSLDHPHETAAAMVDIFMVNTLMINTLMITWSVGGRIG